MNSGQNPPENPEEFSSRRKGSAPGESPTPSSCLWHEISRALVPQACERELAEKLLSDCDAGMPVGIPQANLVNLSDGTIAAFYAALSDRRSCKSPVFAEKDSSWMIRSDFCFLNARACGTGQSSGSFLSATKILPAICANAIHLAPFHPFQFDLVFAVESPFAISDDLIHERLLQAGFSPLEQIQAFIQACHLLGKAVGYDLEPHVAQFARPVLENPELFRWIRLDESRTTVLSESLPFKRNSRFQLSREVTAIVAGIRGNHALDSLERKPDDDAPTRSLRDKAYYEAIRSLIAAGYWPLPSHAWDGAGVPEFSHYDFNGNYPEFHYRNEFGDDVSSHAYSVLTPYVFYDGIHSNRKPDPGEKPEPFRPGIEAYARPFSWWHENAGFDFAQFGSLDHANEDEFRVPQSDQATGEVLNDVLTLARSTGSARIGALAERKGLEFSAYAEMGFDLVLGNAMLRRIDQPLLSECFSLYDQLAEYNEHAERPASVCFAVDTADSGNPQLWGTALVKVMGSGRVALRHFVSRFISVGKGRRPMYETMGYQDLSYGLYDATISRSNFNWVGDERAARCYADIERIYARLRPFMDKGVIMERETRAEYAWWIIRGPESGRKLVCVMSLETAQGDDANRIIIPGGSQGLPIEYHGTLYDFHDSRGAGVCGRGDIIIDRLPFLEFRLFDVDPDNA